MFKNLIGYLIALSTFNSFAFAADKIDYKAYGFSIDQLPSNTDFSGQALMMFSTAADGFAPNVNVMVQKYPGTIQDYIKLSKTQMTDAKMKMVSEPTIDKSAATLEYEGVMQGKSLHFFAKAISKNGKIYLATATLPSDQWAKNSKSFKDNVNSLEVK